MTRGAFFECWYSGEATVITERMTFFARESYGLACVYLVTELDRLVNALVESKGENKPTDGKCGRNTREKHYHSFAFHRSYLQLA
jgi:hypothetical protein